MIGISSFAFHDLPLAQALEKIESLTDCAEIFSEGRHDLLREEEVAFSYDLTYTVHAPSTDINLASVREPIRMASLQLVKQMADICNDLDSDIMVIHPGYFPFSSDGPAAMKAFERSVPVLEDISTDSGVKICVENMPQWDCFLFRYPQLDIGGNGFTLDIGHANTLGNLPEFLDVNISHFHLHDNNGTIDEHLPIGEGNIDMGLLVDLLKKSNAIKIIENKCEDDVHKSLEALNNLGVD